ncbi:proton pump complex quinol oxidase subunit SoxB [Acidianus manzaensis]|uniref:Cytochrome B6 n=1 Tax=Acidianus manzaensis TaxID=282676 RepID=A0A1W6JY91_9CREN|nr:proton pump complex quinol oxidase subunit SoxB [Acidianus manzaensis]ARM75281.1 cytochrome B6 [Acidianus manzaensis]
MAKLYPKSTLGISFLYTAGGLAWLAAMGLAAMWFRTILLNPHVNPKSGYAVAPLYYFLVTFHGQAGMMMIVIDIAIAVAAYGFYKAGMSIVHNKIMTIAFWIINLPMIVEFAGGPTTGWYMYPPLALQAATWIIYGAMKDASTMIGLAYFMMFLNTIGVIIASVVLFLDGVKTRPREGKIPIFAAYGMTFAGPFIFITEPALSAATLWYTLYFWAKVPVNPLTWVVLFWFWGHPIVYYAPFAIFGGIYYLIPKFSGRSLFSEKWARWNIALLFTFGMLVWVHHLQTWPLPVVLRAFITPTTLILAAGSGLTVLNLGLTIFTGNYKWKDPVAFAALIALIGFILAGLQALLLPINPLNVIVHNTYYIVGHFHLMIWTIIVVGYVAILLDALKTKMGNADFSSLAKGMIGGGLTMWTVGALALGYTMSYAGYEGLIRRWVAYPVKFLPFMEAMTYFAIMMGASFVMYGIPVLFTLLGVKTSLFWTTGPMVSVGGLPGPGSGPIASSGVKATGGNEKTESNEIKAEDEMKSITKDLNEEDLVHRLK